MPTGSAEDFTQALTLGYTEIYTDDARRVALAFIDEYGFTVIGYATHDHYGPTLSFVLRQADITLVVTEGKAAQHPAVGYSRRHGYGVADLAFRTADANEAFRVAVARGARPVHAPLEYDGFVLAAIEGFGDVRHTLVQPPPVNSTAPIPGFSPTPAKSLTGGDPGLAAMDHFAVCVPAETLDEVTGYYASVLGFHTVFEEQIVRGSQAMNSRAIRSQAGDLTLTVLSPSAAHEPGQIDDFLRNHGGAGVQHIAFSCDDIVNAVGQLWARGVEFLEVPDAYYAKLGARLTPARHDLEQLRSMHILADQDHDGQLYQLFTRSTHPSRTLFFEVIERMGSTTFGSGNVRALYEAVAAESRMSAVEAGR